VIVINWTYLFESFHFWRNAIDNVIHTSGHATVLSRPPRATLFLKK
jgi:hypothetical protein